MNAFFTVQSTMLATIQDKGRIGMIQYGIGPNGAADTFAYEAGNALVGNMRDAASVEITAFGFVFIANADMIIAVTGAPATVIIDSDIVNMWQSIVIKAGQTVQVKKIQKGLRVYIAFRGGIVSEPILGSCSVDTIGNLGSKLKAKQKVFLHEPGNTFTEDKVMNIRDIPMYGSPWKIRVCDGCNVSDFITVANDFYQQIYRVSPQSNIIGIRLEGKPLNGYTAQEVISHGVCLGSIQIVPTGTPIITFKGRGGTAGYPIIAVVIAADLDAVGQMRPGDSVQFVRYTVEEAQQAFSQKKNILQRLLV